MELNGGTGLVPPEMAFLGTSEVLLNVERGMATRNISGEDSGSPAQYAGLGKSVTPIARGTVLRSFLSILPGGRPDLFLLMPWDKKTEKFRTGVIEGIASLETANNPATGGAFIPILFEIEGSNGQKKNGAHH